MTDIYLSYLNCPKCGEKNPHQRHNIIDIGLEPELTKQIIDWEFSNFRVKTALTSSLLLILHYI